LLLRKKIFIKGIDMVIIGAGGHAREILDILTEKCENICFFDNISKFDNEKFLGKYPIITSLQELRQIFKVNPEFVLGIGKSSHRKMLFHQCLKMGGKPESVIANTAMISQYAKLGQALNIMQRVFVSNSAIIGDGSLINAGALIHHDVQVGCFCEISPGVILTGGTILGNSVTIGAGAVVTPNVCIGGNAVIGAGSVVITDIQSNSLAVGVPAKVIKVLPEN
jgi:sugar O-acyltransferase (sialic acid O-acetyltransferase NeuD family)